MTLIMNPGSRIAREPQGWTNSHTRAAEYSAEWTRRMAAAGFRDITVVDTGDEREGRWLFTYTHNVTGVTVELWHHGIDDLDAYRKQCIFDPRVYWCGSSCAEPAIDDFATHGFEAVLTFRAVP